MTLTLSTTQLEVTRLSGTIGAEITGIDLRQLDEPTVTRLRQLWIEHKVLFFPAQHLTLDEQITFAQRFGELTEGHPIIPGPDGHPEVFEVDYTKSAKLKAAYGNVASQERGLGWHTDITFVERPPAGSVLRPIVIPEAGGDTQWSDQQAAFEALSPDLQHFLETLTAEHDGRDQFQAALDHFGPGRWEEGEVPEIRPVTHPVVRTHPESGAKVLFVNAGFTKRIVELHHDESRLLLNFLYRHSVRPEFTVRYHWHEGGVAFWDNRSTQHSVVGDFDGQHRVIQRVTIKGDVPR